MGSKNQKGFDTSRIIFLMIFIMLNLHRSLLFKKYHLLKDISNLFCQAKQYIVIPLYHFHVSTTMSLKKTHVLTHYTLNTHHLYGITDHLVIPGSLIGMYLSLLPNFTYSSSATSDTSSSGKFS